MATIQESRIYAVYQLLGIVQLCAKLIIHA
nr:MAG TPA: hypothetical protein [Caudoviricetes sp.]